MSPEAGPPANSWTQAQLDTLASANTVHVSPRLAHEATYATTATRIWSVVVDGALYARAYRGRRSHWYRTAMASRRGRIRVTGLEYDVAFTPADPALLDAVEQAYRTKYVGSSYLAPMLDDGARATTVQITPTTTHPHGA